MLPSAGARAVPSGPAQTCGGAGGVPWVGPGLLVRGGRGGSYRLASRDRVWLEPALPVWPLLSFFNIKMKADAVEAKGLVSL